ncbi:F-box/kelch-repeat protein At3g23880-like [Arachis hypogaea]|uniref:F-box/kelch-repeat protein At3g23880-like n=1 Tax=Arachis hypogaea TaxID=3818 RepID=UPI000DECD214|nr:F-box/kelch-repeat protein At3g23880-like [Arachis hypogaea]
MNSPLHDDDNDYERKGKVVTTTGMPALMDELIEEILLRIPASSLVRLRNSVCGSWRTLISSSQFAQDHLRRSMAVDLALTHLRIAYYSYSNPIIGIFSARSVFENPPREPTKVVPYEGRRCRSIIGSCNGLLCLLDDELEDRAILWNPCTGLTSQPLKIGGIFHYCGFGYDHVNDKYKLLGIVIKKSGESVTRIFTFGPKSNWRTIQDFPYRLLDRDNKASVVGRTGRFVSGTGTLNWLLRGRRSSFVAVLSVDLVKETYSQFSAPSRDSDDDRSVFPRLDILGGCLAVCYETKKTHWTLWLMKEYGVPQSWTKLAIIRHHPLLINSRLNYVLRPMYMLKNDVLLGKSPSGSISTFKELADLFTNNFAAFKIYVHDSDYLSTIKQGQPESFRDYMTKFNKIAMEIPNLNPDVHLYTFMSGLRPSKFHKTIVVSKSKTLT